ncbi:hypothetical protein Sjap_018142 [Stephania japonica]|uniref:Uncharacterized protein n=1 Tax=Stephania japonica TaxID=461633 RepID=A0AAP0I7I2_9MAGN
MFSLVIPSVASTMVDYVLAYQIGSASWDLTQTMSKHLAISERASHKSRGASLSEKRSRERDFDEEEKTDNRVGRGTRGLQRGGDGGQQRGTRAKRTTKMNEGVSKRSRRTLERDEGASTRSEQ